MKNFFEELHPFFFVCYMLSFFLLFAMLPYDGGMILIFLVLSVQTIYLKGLRQYGKSLLGYLSMILIFGVFNVIFYHEGDTPFLYINGQPLTVEAFRYGICMGFMAADLILFFQMISGILDSGKVIWLFGRVLPVTGLVISMVFCFYDKFLYKIDKIKEVWNTYRIGKQYGSVKYTGILWTVLLNVMLEDSVDTALAMSARGYGRKRQTRYRNYEITAEDIILFGAVMILFLAGIWLSEYRIGIVLFLAGIPLIYNVYKELKWKYYLWKI